MSKLRISGNQNNVLEIFHKSSRAEVTQGLRWYKTASELITRIMRSTNREYDRGYELTRPTCLGIAAAISPQKSWARNVKIVEDVIRDGTSREMIGIQRRKVEEILRGAEPLEVLSGQKERAFYECLTFHKTTRSVTVDGHTLAIWLGSFIPTSEAIVTPRLFRLAVEDYRAVADAVGIRPHQLQATCWVAWRRLHTSRGHTSDQKNGL